MRLDDGFPSIKFRYPTLDSGLVSDAQPQIITDWSSDLDSTALQDSDTRNRLFVLMDDSTSTVILTDFTSYEAGQRRLIITPSQTLDRAKTFRVLVKRGVPDTYGRRSNREFTWTFQTASGGISTVELLTPEDLSLQSSIPIFSWSSTITGSPTYVLQIDDTPNFTSLIYTTSTLSTSLTPASTAFSEGNTYYWRVRAYTASASSAWSSTFQFYYGTIRSLDESTRQTWRDADLFGVDRLYFKDGASNLADWPPNIAIRFTSDPASDFQNYISIWQKSVLPRNDSRVTYDEAEVTGTWSVSGRIVTFLPSGSIAENTRYTIRIDSLMTNTSGLELEEDYEYYFVGKYNPFYVDPILIQSRFRAEGLTLNDDLINYFIYVSSLEAKAKYWSQFQVYAAYGDFLLESTVRDTQNLISFGVLMWTAARTTYSILLSILTEELRSVGRTRRLGSFAESLTDDFVDAIKLALQKAKEEMEEWDDKLTPSIEPLAIHIHSRFDTKRWDSDTSIPIERIRDDWFNR